MSTMEGAEPREDEIRDEEKGDLRSGDIINIFRYDELYNK